MNTEQLIMQWLHFKHTHDEACFPYLYFESITCVLNQFNSCFHFLLLNRIKLKFISLNKNIIIWYSSFSTLSQTELSITLYSSMNFLLIVPLDVGVDSRWRSARTWRWSVLALTSLADPLAGSFSDCCLSPAYLLCKRKRGKSVHRHQPTISI